MSRKEVSGSELVTIINHELSGLEACPGCRIEGVVPLVEPDEKGCNWMRPQAACRDAAVSVCIQAFEQVTHWARAHYNLAPRPDWMRGWTSFDLGMSGKRQ